LIIHNFILKKLLDSLKRLATINEIKDIFWNKSSWESKSYHRSIAITQKKSKKLEPYNSHHRKSKSYNIPFDFDSLLTVSKPQYDLTVRKIDSERENISKVFLNNIDNTHSKIMQLNLESKMIKNNESRFNKTMPRIKKEENLMNLFATNSNYRSEISHRQKTHHKERVKTISSYIEKGQPQEINRTFKEDFYDNLNSAILYKTLKCAKLIPNQKKIKDFSKFFNKIKMKFQQKSSSKQRNTEITTTTKKEGGCIGKTKESNHNNENELFNFCCFVHN